MKKGDKNGECNRSSCSNKNVDYYNHSTLKYYCASCAAIINYENMADSIKMFNHELCTKS